MFPSSPSSYNNFDIDEVSSCCLRTILGKYYKLVLLKNMTELE